MAKRKADKPGDSSYDDHRRDAAGRSRERSQRGREIGPVPKVAKPRRRAKCRKSLRVFCETYLADRFPLKWSADHLKVLARMQLVATSGGQFALAMPRGSGKTTLSEACAAWALLFGLRRFVVLIGSTSEAACEMLDSIKGIFEDNDLVAEDFPEVCYPIRMLEGIANRCAGQTSDGVRTRIEWTDDRVTLPTVKGSAASGARLRVVGITGRVRGMKAAVDGKVIRPDLVIPDDPQTDDSAWSGTQNHKRERILAGAVLKLAGPGQKIAALCPCTVIAPGDLADRMLDRDRHPEWQGERMKMLYSLPTAEVLWEEYARLRSEGLKADRGTAEATAYYVKHRAEMDAGAVAAWPERFDPDQVSAIQYAMDLRIDDPFSFAAEAQNEPLDPQALGAIVELEPDEVSSRLNGLRRGLVPHGVTRLTCGIDVQMGVLYWLVAGWDEHFGGAVIDYGCWPRQPRAYFRSDQASPTFADLFPGMSAEGRVYAALQACVAELLERRFERAEGGESLPLERVVADANWGAMTETVYQWWHNSPHKGQVWPSHGKYIGASGRPMSEWRVEPGERAGMGWRLSAPGRGRGRHLTIDVNQWKSHVAERLRTEPGRPGALFLSGSHAYEHQLLADHLTSEYRVVTQGQGRTVHEWKVRPDRPENHWLDCLVMAAVGASTQGLTWSAAAAAGVPEPPRTQKKVSLSELQRQKREARNGP